MLIVLNSSEVSFFKGLMERYKSLKTTFQMPHGQETLRKIYDYKFQHILLSMDNDDPFLNDI